jgi:hypothetical protein
MNRYVACAKKVAGNDIAKYGPFAVCMDKNWKIGEQVAFVEGTSKAVAEDCAGKASMDLDAIEVCFKGADGH